MKMTKSEALQHIRELFDECKRKGTQPMLYYTGHGEIGTGNWCFADGTISIQEIFDMLPGEMCYPMIFSDACYSGHWANFCLWKGIPGFNCLAACPEYSQAVDNEGVLSVRFHKFNFICFGDQYISNWIISNVAIFISKFLLKCKTLDKNSKKNKNPGVFYRVKYD